MNQAEVEDALHGIYVKSPSGACSLTSPNSAEFAILKAKPLAPSSALSTYYDEGGSLSCIAVDARSGPQVVLRGMRLAGRVPSDLEDEFDRYLELQGQTIMYSQSWDPSSSLLGVVLRAQRVDDVVLTRPVFVSRAWADRCGDESEGPIPRSEWQRY
ncbi:hypothetical protein [Streptomyces sp. S816]|uniref:hypothetical protein n=1 Tax=Streptomyces sp. S816 TaxID=2283197 RepID=UPI001FF8A10F|nr:hypothetical protein [Streptomyces sp. S816]